MNLIEEIDEAKEILAQISIVSSSWDVSKPFSVLNKCKDELQNKEWISVDDKLPHEDQLCDCHIDKYRLPSISRIITLFQDGHFNYNGFHPITHWKDAGECPTGEIR